MKKCERCGAVEIPKTRHYCDECKIIKQKEAYARKKRYQTERYHSAKGYFNFLGNGKKIGKLTRKGAIRLSIAVIRQAVRDKKWRWLESENSDIFFDLAEIDKGKFIDKVLEQLYYNHYERLTGYHNGGE